MKLTEEDAAYAAAAWASGLTQREIAHQFGQRRPAVVCISIARFLERYAGVPVIYTLTRFYDEHLPVIQGNARKALVPQALQAFKVRREVSLTKGTTP